MAHLDSDPVSKFNETLIEVSSVYNVSTLVLLYVEFVSTLNAMDVDLRICHHDPSPTDEITSRECWGLDDFLLQRRLGRGGTEKPILVIEAHAHRCVGHV